MMNEIVKKIFWSSKLSKKEKGKNLLYYASRRRGAMKSWNRRHHKVIELNKKYIEPCSNEIEKAHQELWSTFRKKVDFSTIRICKNLSGNEDPRIIPEDIFVSDIEPSLLTDSSVYFFSHKSFYNRWFPKGIFPKDFLHCIDGQFFDHNLNPITLVQYEVIANSILYPVVMKPNTDSYGGKDVYFVKCMEELVDLSGKMKNYVVQEKIDQHGFFKKFNPVGLNTFRVYVYRSVKDKRLHVLSISLRMGIGGGLDNETAGGIHIYINENGFMNGYAVNKHGIKYYEHPDTGLNFNFEIPDFKGLKAFAIKIASQVYLTSIVGLDICMDDKGEWRAIEINTSGHAVMFAQYGGMPFFGEFTDEVIEYCNINHWALK